MGLLQLMLSWVNRIVVLVSVVLFMLTLMCKETDLPFSQASIRVAHLCSFSAWFGASIWVSFIAGVVLMKAVDIETFGLAQTKLFDAYFRFSLLCLAVAGFSAAGLSSTREGGDPVLGKTPFLVALGCVALNLFFFGPQTTISMMERRRVCKELGVDRKSLDPQVRRLSKRFGMFHGVCNMLNLASLACGAVHVCALAGRLNL
eukprot:jgi/Undpi1/2589/HiC_scaffold_13.g05968.m1